MQCLTALEVNWQSNVWHGWRKELSRQLFKLKLADRLQNQVVNLFAGRLVDEFNRFDTASSTDFQRDRCISHINMFRHRRYKTPFRTLTIALKRRRIYCAWCTT